MKYTRRALGILLALAVCFSFMPGYTDSLAEETFRIPDGVKEIGQEAFQGVSIENGVFIPESVINIAPDAFDANAGTMIYGFSGSAAEAYAASVGAGFTKVDIANARVSAPEAIVSPNRPVTITAAADCDAPLTYRFVIEKEGVAVADSGSVSENVFSYTFTQYGAYTLRATISNAWTEIAVQSESALEVLEPLLLTRPAWQIAVGQSAVLIDDAETREVTLVSSDPEGLQIDGYSVTGLKLGAYTVAASAVTEAGTVYTDIPVEVLVPVTEISISAPSDKLVEGGGTLQLTASVLPEDATYPFVVWSSLNEDIANVDDDGLVTSIKQGTAVIRATAGDTVKDFTVRIVKLTSSLTIFAQDAPAEFYTNMTLSLTATATPSEADDPTVSWSSLNEEVAKVNAQTGIVTGTGAGEATIVATANDGGGATAQYGFTVLQGAEAIVISNMPSAMRAGETAQPAYQVLPDTAAEKTLTWKSDNENVATVNINTGLVTAIAPGTCDITATANNGISQKYTLLVAVPETKVEKALSTVYLNPGMTSDPYGYVFIYPENATFRTLSWTSSQPAYVSVDAQTGKISAIAKGSAVVTGTSRFGLKVSFTVQVVTDAYVIQSQAVSPTYAVMTLGETLTITPSCSPAKTKYATGVWYSDNASVAAVSGGTVIAQNAGTATVYAISSSGIAAACQIYVRPTVIRGLALNMASLSINKGDSFALKASYTPASADDLNITWSSSSPDIASVSASGVVYALAGGVTTITASTEDGVSAQCVITVNTEKMTSAALAETEISGNAGDTRALTYTFEPANATPAAFSWTSDANAVADVNEAGLVKLVSAGTTVIRGQALDGSGLTLECNVTVTETPIEAFELDTASVSLSYGETHQLLSQVTPESASYAAPVYTSGDEDVATVSATGLITAVSKGSCVVTAKVGYGEYEKTLAVSVQVTSDSVVSYRALVVGQFSIPGEKGFLPFSSNGTRGVSDALKKSVIDGNRYSVRLMGANPTPSAFRSAIDSLANNADSNDVTVVFLLTHGSYNSTKGYYMETSSGTDIWPADLIPALKQISGHVVFVLCTCNSGRILSSGAVTTLSGAGGVYEGKNGEGRLSILCSSTNTVSSYWNIQDTSISRDFFTYAFTRGLGWDMIGDSSLGSLLADSNGDGKITLGEISKYSRSNTQRAISAFIQLYGTDQFTGNQSQYPSWKFATGESDLVLFGK